MTGWRALAAAFVIVLASAHACRKQQPERSAPEPARPVEPALTAEEIIRLQAFGEKNHYEPCVKDEDCSGPLNTGHQFRCFCGYCVDLDFEKLPGQACRTSGDCYGGLRCLDGRCAWRARLEEPCSHSCPGGDCVVNECDANLTCIKNVCQAPRKRGEECERHENCIDPGLWEGSVCLSAPGSAAGKCVPRPGPGESCLSPDPTGCNEDPRSSGDPCTGIDPCRNGSMCLGGACVKVAGGGGKCGPGIAVCGGGYRCKNGRCMEVRE